MQNKYEIPVKVECYDCDKRFDEEKVTIDGIEEDDRGRDVVYFDCPECGKPQRSHRYG